LVSRFGAPAVITSDCGTQFTSAVWEALCKRLHIQHITTTAFHPCSNGMVERCHRQLKDALRHGRRQMTGRIIFHGYCWA
jgi:transposase InsO family protein